MAGGGPACHFVPSASIDISYVKNLDVMTLSKILFEEFDREDWGLVDPNAFDDPPKKEEASEEDYGGLYEVMERVIQRLNKFQAGVRNPDALDDDALELIERLLGGYETALENKLYKDYNITQDVKDIENARQIIENARKGETFEEWCDSMEQQNNEKR